MIEAKNLTMYYGAVCALDDVSFLAKENEIVGLLGPNGAGKSTLMRILTTFIYPAKGNATICGFDVTQDALSVRKLIGYLPEHPPLYMDMRVDEFIDFVGQARGLFRSELRKKKEWAIEATQISGVLKHIISELSLGYRQRVGLAQALLHDPKVVILDEPTSGLDPMQIVSIRKLIRELAKSKTIIFSTHILQEASAVADRLLIIDRGKIIADNTAEGLKKAYGQDCMVYVAFHAPKAEAFAALKSIPNIKEVKLISESGQNVRFLCASSSFDEVGGFVTYTVKQKGWLLKELALKEPSLEEVFLNLFSSKEK